jgi:hypothetical protein
MVRIVVTAIFLFCCPIFAFAQTQSSSGPAAQPSVPAAKKPAPKSKAAAKPAAPADNGPCRIGVIPALGDIFMVKKIGITVFGNEQSEVPVSWGLDELIVARVRAAAGSGVRRLPYAKGAFEPYYNPQIKLFRDPRADLAKIVRQIAGSSNCERYLVVTREKITRYGTNQILSGAGIVSRGLSKSSMFAYYQITVLDGQSFAIYKNPFATLASAFTARPKNDRDVDDAFPATPADAASSSILRDGIRALLTENLDYELPAFLSQQPTAN